MFDDTKPSYFCRYCGAPLHVERQECGPYTRNDAGQIVALGVTLQFDCRNANTDGAGQPCDAYMATASGPNWQATIDRYVEWMRSERAFKAVAHA